MDFSFMAIPERLSAKISLLGEQKTGKSTLIMELVAKMLQYQGKGSILLDVGNQYHEIHKISVAEIKNWGLNINQLQTKHPIVRVVFDKTKLNTRPKQLEAFAEYNNYVSTYVSNSCVIYEDVLSMIDKVPPFSLKSVFYKHRDVCNDIFSCIHSYADCPSFFFSKTDIFYCKFTKDVDLPKKAIYIPEFKAIRKVLERENDRIVNLSANVHSIQYATVEFIADIPFQTQIAETGVPFNQF